jgi:phage replication O-like protein O
MANPQPEPYVKISMELIEKGFMRKRISGECWQVLWCIIRKTYGWKKKTDIMALSQISKETGLSRQHVHRSIKKLEQMNIISVTNIGYKIPAVYGLIKDYDLWQSVTKNGYSSKNGCTQKGVQSVPNNGYKSVPNIGTTIDTRKKCIERYEVLRKKLTAEAPAVIMIVKFFKMTLDADERKRYLPNKTNWKGKFNWLNTVRLLHEKDGYEYWKIFDIIHYARVEDSEPRNGDFCWKNNLLTIPALRSMSRSQGIFKIHVIYEKIKETLTPPRLSEIEYIAKEIERYAEEKEN